MLIVHLPLYSLLYSLLIHRWCEGIQGPPPIPGDKEWSPIYSSTTPPFVPSLFTFNVLVMLWDALEPVGCDVHSSGNSLVRDAFMKIMRPGLDYRQTFTAFADKRMPKDWEPEERKRRQDRIGLTKDQLGQLLRYHITLHILSHTLFLRNPPTSSFFPLSNPQTASDRLLPTNPLTCSAETWELR